MKKVTNAPGAPVTKVAHKTKSEKQKERNAKFLAKTDAEKLETKIKLKINRNYKRFESAEAKTRSEAIINSLELTKWFEANLNRLEKMNNLQIYKNLRIEKANHKVKTPKVQKEGWAETHAKTDTRKKK